MDRREAISTIEALFPIDSQYAETNAIGERLLAQAKREHDDWRNLPVEGADTKSRRVTRVILAVSDVEKDAG